MKSRNLSGVLNGKGTKKYSKITFNNKYKLLLAAVFSLVLPANGAQLTPTLDPNCAYDLIEIPASEATEDSIVKFVADENGNFTPQYYNVQIKEDATGSSTRFQNSGLYDTNADNQADNLTGNYVSSKYTSTSTSSLAGGGAVFNSGEVGDINGHYINNNTTSTGNGAAGGAIINYKDKTNASAANIINNITGDFIGNTAVSTNASSDINKNLAGGGAIFNDESGTINSIRGDFISNNATASYGLVAGGAISNNSDSVINSITGNFIKNTATPKNLYGAGGAIFNSQATKANADNGYIGSISGNFIENGVYSAGTVSNYSPFAYGGAICNDGEIGNVDGYFSGNYAVSEISQAIGGAISSIGKIDNISGTFVNNYTKADNSNSIGGAIAIQSPTQSIKADFIGNHTESANFSAQGGAIYVVNSLNTLEGNFYNNYSKSENSASTSGGAINNIGTIENANANFVSNYAESANGTTGGGALYNAGTIKNIKGDFKNNSVYGKNAGGAGGAVWNTGSGDITFTNSNFIDNQVKTDDSETTVRGGAIYNAGEIKINAINGQSLFKGNKLIKGYETEQNAIYSSETGTATLNAEDNGEVVFYDEIDGAQGHKLNFTGNESGKININNNIKNADITNTSYSTNIAEGSYLSNNNSLALNSGTININHMGLTPVSFRNFDLVNGSININNVDVDLKNQQMGRFTSDTYNNVGDAKIYINGVNLVSDAPEDRDVTAIYFAQPEIKENVATRELSLPNKGQSTVYTPIYKYNMYYDTKNQYNDQGDGGYFVFQRGGANSSNESSQFNPAVLATPTANLAAGQAAMNETFRYVFEHADSFTQLPAIERYSRINADKYALSTNFNDNLPGYTQYPDKGVWFRPYTTFETIGLKNGPKVDAITYGSLIGYDGKFEEMKNGWHRVFTGYAGYMGADLSYSNVDSTMNGGLLGFTETFYKGNFWTALTASAGAAVSETHTMYGKEDSTSLLAGVGSKTGYNFEFKDGKFIIQPIMYLSYTFVNTFDYTNAAGVKIDSEPLHTIQINPSIRFIGNLKNGWQPYASVGMVWNLMNESKATANNVKLPEMSVKPYVEYGVGVQRNWSDKFTAFLQAMIRNGGKNGIALTGGFRIMLGEDNSSESNPENKKTIKSL